MGGSLNKQQIDATIIINEHKHNKQFGEMREKIDTLEKIINTLIDSQTKLISSIDNGTQTINQ